MNAYMISLKGDGGFTVKAKNVLEAAIAAEKYLKRKIKARHSSKTLSVKEKEITDIRDIGELINP